MIERWDLGFNCNNPSMDTNENGEFVLYEDHVELINHLLDVLHGIKTQMELQKQVSRNQDREWFDYSIEYIEKEIAKAQGIAQIPRLAGSNAAAPPPEG